jgi:phage baseplate assembly protein W
MATAPYAATDLKGVWRLDGSIGLSWTAPTDSGSSVLSSYEVWVSSTANTTWTLAFVITSKAVRNTATASYILQEPITSATYIGNLNSILAYGFRVYAVNAEQIKSNYVSTMVYQPNSSPTSIPQHLDNGFASVDNSVSPANISIQTNDENGYVEISNSVSMYFGTMEGSRSAVPGYGIADPTFTQLNGNALATDLSQWEPRVNVDVNVTYDDNNEASLQVSILDINGGF